MSDLPASLYDDLIRETSQTITYADLLRLGYHDTWRSDLIFNPDKTVLVTPAHIQYTLAVLLRLNERAKARQVQLLMREGNPNSGVNGLIWVSQCLGRDGSINITPITPPPGAISWQYFSLTARAPMYEEPDAVTNLTFTGAEQTVLLRDYQGFAKVESYILSHCACENHGQGISFWNTFAPSLPSGQARQVA